MSGKFLFVGERPSKRAVEIGATWQNGKLAGKTLRETLTALNIDPDAQLYINLYKLAEKSQADNADCEEAIKDIRAVIKIGYTVVGLGQIVCKQLIRNNVPHLQLTHPAARGAIRLKERYQAHAQKILSGVTA
jgi:uracil-DNA glycosylase